jgi:hypothetical protein
LSAGNISPVDAGLLVNRISTIVGLTSKQINKELNARIARGARAASYGAENKQVPAADLGQGLFAAAQREILEVLLNEPRFYKKIKDRIKADDFDVPLLRQIAQILFDMLKTATDIPLQKLLASVESTDLSNCITKLARDGEEKGNYESRLNAAVDLFDRQFADKNADRPGEAKDQEEFLKRAYQNTRKENPHNIGMT